MSFADLRSARKSKESKSFVAKSKISDTQEESENVHDAHTVPEVETDASEPQTASTSSSRSVELGDKPLVIPDIPIKLPETLEVRKSQDKGRGLYAKQAFAPGAILLSVKPRVAVLSTSQLGYYCSNCAGPAPETGLRRCTGCRVTRYCNAACQNSDWALHKTECQALQRWASAAPSQDVATPPDAVRCLGRILFNIQKKGVDSQWTKELSLLQSHRGSLQPSQFESHTHLAHSVVRYIGASGPSDLASFGLHSAGDLVDLISRFTTNTFTLTSYTLSPIGICISPAMALTNHSCDPNAVIVFPRSSKDATKEPQMQLIALRPISQGEEIVTAYVDVILPKELRQAALKETYNFDCKCSACTSTGPTDVRTSMRCPKSCGGTCQLPTEEDPITRCLQCKAAVTQVDAVLDAVRIGQEALDKATSLQFKDPAKAKQLTTNIIPILTSAGLMPTCHPLLAMSRLHQELLVSELGPDTPQDALDETVRAAAKYNTGVGGILPFGHPVRAVAMAELGKLLAVDEPSPPTPADERGQFPPHGAARLKLAYQTLVQARSELLVGFGKANEGGQLGREVRDTLVQLEKELGVWTEGVKNALEDARLAQAAASKSR
ncbi:SET domain-containing protein [Phanerochaete sordida]|uniref:SET domain-containing protein n=1 Tax=Phanerochaete sordida TaxID=48140 RepID=A0A9P3G1U0_9APHY|nr:SET domain-containing protein [Phanerochaete sordida]